VKSDPRSAEAQYLLGSVQLARRDLDGAAAAFQEVMRLNRAPRRPRSGWPGSSCSAGSFAAATQLAEQAARREPRNLEARLVLADSLLITG